MIGIIVKFMIHTWIQQEPLVLDRNRVKKVARTLSQIHLFGLTVEKKHRDGYVRHLRFDLGDGVQYLSCPSGGVVNMMSIDIKSGLCMLMLSIL